MLKSLPLLLIAASVGLAAPIPKGPPPDPLGRGYMGFFPIDNDSLIVDRPEKGSPAAISGLRPGDEFVQIGNFKPKSFGQLKDYVMDFRPGTEVKIVVRRHNKLVSMRLTLGARPPEADLYRTIPFPDDPDR